MVSISGEMPLLWRPPSIVDASAAALQVSISGEMPLLWRPSTCHASADEILKISISGEMPLLWRPDCIQMCDELRCQFQSQARCRSSGDSDRDSSDRRTAHQFQSQARCRSSGDAAACDYCISDIRVSISGEMPLLWRPLRTHPLYSQICDVSISGEMPLLWRPSPSSASSACWRVSISGEMPLLWRRRSGMQYSARCIQFQSQARCRSSGDLHWHDLQNSAMCSFNLRRDAAPLATISHGPCTQTC